MPANDLHGIGDAAALHFALRPFLAFDFDLRVLADLETPLGQNRSSSMQWVLRNVKEPYGPSSGSSCSSTSETSVPGPIPAAGGTFTHTTTETCPFRVTADVPWITLSVSSSQVFQPQTLTFSFTVAPNTGPARSGFIYLEHADGSGGSGFGIGQAAGTTGAFRTSPGSAAVMRTNVAAGCDSTLSLSNIDASVTRDDRSAFSDARLRVTISEMGPGCANTAAISRVEDYVLHTGSISGQEVVMTLRASSTRAPLSVASFRGRLSDEGRTLTGELLFHNVSSGAGVTIPITFRQSQ